jgi:hypothetical protein
LLIADLRKSQQEELSRLEKLLQQEREMRQSRDQAEEAEKEARLKREAEERQKIIDEAVRAAKATSQMAIAMIEEKERAKQEKLNKKPAEVQEDDEDFSDGEFFVKDYSNVPVKQKKKAPEIESFMSISKQHEKRGFG